MEESNPFSVARATLEVGKGDGVSPFGELGLGHAF